MDHNETCFLGGAEAGQRCRKGPEACPAQQADLRCVAINRWHLRETVIQGMRRRIDRGNRHGVEAPRAAGCGHPVTRE